MAVTLAGCYKYNSYDDAYLGRFLFLRYMKAGECGSLRVKRKYDYIFTLFLYENAF